MVSYAKQAAALGIRPDRSLTTSGTPVGHHTVAQPAAFHAERLLGVAGHDVGGM